MKAFIALMVLLAIIVVALIFAFPYLPFPLGADEKNASRVVEEFCRRDAFGGQEQGAGELVAPQARNAWVISSFWGPGNAQCYDFDLIGAKQNGPTVRVAVRKDLIDRQGNLDKQELTYVLARDGSQGWLITGMSASRGSEAGRTQPRIPRECAARGDFTADDAMAIVEKFLLEIKMGRRDQAILYVTPGMVLTYSGYFDPRKDSEGWDYSLSYAQEQDGRWFVFGEESLGPEIHAEVRYEVIRTGRGFFLDGVVILNPAGMP
jgi:hypothetical protein